MKTIPDEIIAWWGNCLQLGYIPQFFEKLGDKWPTMTPLWAVQITILETFKTQCQDIGVKTIGKWLRELLPTFEKCRKLSRRLPGGKQYRDEWLKFPTHEKCRAHYNEHYARGSRYKVKFNKPHFYISVDKNGLARIFLNEMVPDGEKEMWLHARNKTHGGLLGDSAEGIVARHIPPGTAVRVEVTDWFFVDEDLKNKHFAHIVGSRQMLWY